jgi:NADH:ubiquinone oxidoreductase subunit 3 (subunit A)
MLASLGAVFVVLLATLGVFIVARWLDHALDPTELTAPERVPFAGGHEPQTHALSRYHARYYAMAFVFLAFDMEMVYMYPWAVVFVREGAIALAEMGMFITILLLGVLYAWRERALEWA